jgi:hypothetical protein
VIDWSAVLSKGLDVAPTAIGILLAVWVVWFVWRLIQRLFRFASRSSEDVQTEPPRQTAQERREPVLERIATPVSSIPDAADVLALKASIDALTRQIAALEKRLAPPAPARPTADRSPIERPHREIPVPVEPPSPPERLRA